MSSIRLKSKKDIKDFFKILAEESVKDAKGKILDMGAKHLQAQSKLDKKAFGNIREEEEEVIDDLDISIEEPAEEPAGEEQQAAPAETPQSDSPFDVSLDSIANKINMMRGGISVDDSSVQKPLRTYFDLLSDPERKALYAFLNAIAAMMTGESTGEGASDPSDPPYNVTMQSSSEDNDELEVEDETLPSPGDEDIEVEDEDIEELPSTGIPIKVGGVQSKESISEIRKKVLALLGKS